MTARSCEQVRHELDAFVGGDLDGRDVEAVRDHLRECLSCRNAAASLHRAIKSLRGLATAGHPGVDEAMFATMHASILERVADDSPRGVERFARVRRALPIAAAMAVFAIGWWSVRTSAGASVFERPPIGTLVNGSGPVNVVPWSGPRVPLQKLGNEQWDAEADADGGVGPGMMGRWRLRTLEGVDAPVRPRVPARADDGGIEAADRRGR